MKSINDLNIQDPDLITIDKTIAGDTRQFASLIRKYNPLLYKIARTYCQTHEDAEDIMQETHFAAYQQLHNFRKEASYKTWITRILINKCYQHIQYRQRKMPLTSIDILKDNTPETHDYYDGQHCTVNKELGKYLEESLQKLPLLYRSVFVLRKIEGFSITETADILGISPINVKTRLNRANALLRKHLNVYYSVTEIYDFHLKHCTPLLEKVMGKISPAIHGLNLLNQNNSRI